MSSPSRRPAAVFLSYAREDTDSARRIADALRAFGVEVWFDQNELRGGEAWDAKIKTQIRECALFLAVISAHTQARREGYFRREWNLAVERTLDMAHGTPFVVPVVIDGTTEATALVPEQFLRVQWTHLAQGVPTPQFVEQVKRLLESPVAPISTSRSNPVSALPAQAPPAKYGFPLWAAGMLAVLVLGLGAYIALGPSTKSPAPTSAPAASPKTATADKSAAPAAKPPMDFTSPSAVGSAKAEAKSIAVLPFANMSPDKDNEFFADGVHEDVITNLAKIRDLKVISRTSVLAYRDVAGRNLKRIAAELGVATVLEGSVRRAGNKVKVTAQLIDARTDEHLWAETYDRDLTDVFTIQSALAQEIASALKASLTAGERALIAARPTQNQQAYDLYLRARTTFVSTGVGNIRPRENMDRIIGWLEQAVEKDPAFAAAYAQLAYLNGRMYWYSYFDPTEARRERAGVAMKAAQRLAPDRPETRLAVGAYAYYCENNWNRALEEFRAAEAGLPNDAQLTYFIGLTQRRLGQLPDAVGYFTRSLELNPRDILCAQQQLQTLAALRRYPAAIELATRTLAFFPDDSSLLMAARRARLELEGNPASYLGDWEKLPTGGTDPSGASKRYQIAMARGDFDAAESALADSRLTELPALNGVISDPIARHRALVAWLRGKPEAAAAFADEAIAIYRKQSWTPRQTGAVMLGTALSQAVAGRHDEAVKLAREAYAWQMAHDVFTGTDVLTYVASVYLIADRREDAFNTLRAMMAGPCQPGPEQLRLDPLWRRVKDDPRFEEILKSAKRL